MDCSGAAEFLNSVWLRSLESKISIGLAAVQTRSPQENGLGGSHRTVIVLIQDICR